MENKSIFEAPGQHQTSTEVEPIQTYTDFYPAL